MLKKLFIPFILFLFLALQGGAANDEKSISNIKDMPLQVLRYKEVFNIANKLSDRLWGEHIPYEEVPVIAYDLGKKEEYLINHTNPDLKEYKPTDFFINSKRVYKKIGDLTFKFPGGLACHMINGFPTVSMGYGEDTPLESIVQTFIHEGFHYFQFSSLYKQGIGDASSSIRSEGFMAFPRTANYDMDLVIEGKLLFDFTNDKSPETIEPDKLKELVATEIKRKEKLNMKACRTEDFEFLTEGTAAYVELKAIGILLNEGIPATCIPKGIDPHYNYFSKDIFQGRYEANLAHFGPTMLKNKIKFPSTAQGEITYRYALALVRVLEKLSSEKGLAWQKGLFPLITETNLTKEEALEKFYNNLKENNLSKRLIKLTAVPENETNKIYQETQAKYLSKEEIKEIEEKINIEQNIDSYPFEPGWTYKIETKQFVLPYFNFLDGKQYADKTTVKCVYFNGLQKVATSDQRLLIEKISIPVIVNMYRGNVRFKDIGHTSADARIDSIGKSGNCYKELKLKIEGLELTVKNVEIEQHPEEKETLLKFCEN